MKITGNFKIIETPKGCEILLGYNLNGDLEENTTVLLNSNNGSREFDIDKIIEIELGKNYRVLNSNESMIIERI